jgi:protein TonB
MSYQALLFCPDEKTARTVTQVLTDLEFEVDACIETFAAVKKLMGGHFDAVVVDCDNEQNATLLFKSARNSAANQASLAVAVVEGQAGVAKAFRIGANLVLTKPINIEQAKGTLRVARGLLRKGEPNKVVPSATAPPSAPVGEVVPKSVMPPKPAQPPKPVVSSQPKPPIEKPASRPAWPTPASIPAAAAHATAHASANTSAPREDEEIPEIILDDSPDTPEESPASIAAPAAPAPSLAAPSLAAPKLPISGLPTPAKAAPKAQPARPSTTFGSGAASAPAPAREPQPPQIIEAPAKPLPDAVSHQVEELARNDASSLASHAPAPSFTFGGANVAETGGGSKKILTGVGILAIVAAGGYFGWTYSQRQPASPATSISKPVASVQPQPVVAQPVAPKATAAPLTQPASQPATSITSASDDSDTVPVSKPSAAPATKPSPSAASTSAKADSAKADVSEPAPLIVKGGSKPAVQGKVSIPDVSAPSVIGIGAGNSGELPPNIASTTSNIAPKPLLQRMSISQGVSQGLLIKKVQPVYPHNGLSMGLEGSVQLLATISKNGDITAIKVVNGDPQLAHSATEAVKQWKYKPYLLDGEPVEIQTPITINFKLPR